MSSNLATSDMFKGQILSAGSNLANTMAESYLSAYGKVRLNFRLTEHNHFEGEGDMLLPLFEGESNLVFMQLGSRSMQEGRWIANMGLGQRWLIDDSWILGYNAFLDYDLTRDHTRGSIGAELRYDWLQLSSNYYIPLSGWKGSKDLYYHEERPARGWDVRLKGYMPWHENLAVTGSYTKWYGDKVGVFGSSSTLVSNPNVWSYGLEYTPIPLVSAYLTQQRTENGQTNTEGGLRFTYSFSMPFRDQIRFSKVKEMRTARANLYDFVDRENKIILEYRESRLSVGLGAYFFTVPSGGTVRIPVLSHSASAITSLVWEGSGANFNSSNSLTEGFFTVPPYLIGGTNIYTVRAVARNASGHMAHSDYATIEVMPLSSPHLNLVLSSNPLSNNTTSITATLTDGSSPIPGQQIDWTIVGGTGSGTLNIPSSITNGSGQAVAILTGLTAGTVTLRGTLTANPGIFQEITVTVTQTGGLRLALMAHTNPVVVSNTTLLTATLNQITTLSAMLPRSLPPMQGHQINWSIVGGTGTGTLDGTATYTDTVGETTATLTTITPGTLTLRTTLDSDGSVYDEATVTIMTTAPIYAMTSLNAAPNPVMSGTDSTLTATLMADGLPIPNQPITWSIVNGTGGATLSTASSNTDNNGEATTVLHTAAAGTLILRAALTADSSIHRDVPVIITPAAPNYNLSLNAAPNPVANGSVTTLTAMLTDDGSPASGRQIIWTVIGGTGGGTLGTLTSTTNGSGQATTTLNATLGGTLTLRATLASNSAVYKDVIVTITPSYALALNANATNITNGGSSTLTATLTDNGMPVAGKQIDWSIVSGTGTGTLSTTSSGTNSSGQAGLAFTATLGGTLTLRAALSSDSSIHQDIIVTIAPVYDIALNASPMSIVNGTTSILTATLTDNGISLAGRQINWSVIGGTGNGTLGTGSSNTNTGGQATAPLTATGVGTIILRATLASDPAVFEDVTVTATAIAPLYALALTPVPSVANGATTTLAATVTDNGSLIAGEIVNWTIVGGTGAGTLGSSSSTSGADGKATGSLTAMTSGTLTVRGTLASDPSVFKDFLITITPTYTLGLSASFTTITNGASSTLTAALNDNGTPVPGQTVNWSIVGGTGNGTLDTPNSSTNPAGQATATFTATFGGTLVLRATLASNSSIHQDIAITITPTYGLTLAATPSTIISGDTSQLVAILTDGILPVSGRQIDWSITGGTGSGMLSTTSSGTFASGQATVVLTATAPGTLNLRATLASDSSIFQEVIVTITPGIPVYNLALSAAPDPVLTGNTSLVTAVLLDGLSPASGQQINWSITNGPGSGTLSAPNSSTDATGTATVTLTATSSGTLTLRATLASDSSVHQDVTIQIVPILSTYSLSLSATPTTINNATVSTLTAMLTDGGTPVSGQSINWSIIGGTGNGTLSTSNSNTNVSGLATATLTATHSGTLILRASLASDSSVFQNVTITITPVYTLVLNAAPTTIDTGDPATLTATLTDGGIAVSGKQINWAIVSGTGNATLSTSNSSTNAGGQATATLTATTGGTLILRASLASDSSIFQNVAVTIAPVYSLNLSASLVTITNGGTSVLTATLSDGGMPVSGQSVNWSIISGTGGGNLSTASSSTNGAGQATTTLHATLGGTLTMRVSLASDPSIFKDVTVTIVSLYNLALNASPVSIVNGNTSTITAVLTDNGTPVSGQTINWSIVGGTGNGTLGSTASSTNVGGQATVTLTATTSGTITLRARLASDSSVLQDVIITVTPTYTLSLNATPVTIANGNASTLTATLTDNGSSMAGQQISWSIVGGTGNGTLSTVSSNTNAGGQATVTITATASGTLTLRGTVVSSGSVHQDVTITITPVYLIALSAAPASVVNGGISTLNATLTDNGLPVSGKQIDWSIINGTGSGTLGATSSITNAGGVATVSLNATFGGSLTLRAGMAGNSGIFKDVTLTIVPVYAIALNANPDPIDNGDTSILTAMLTDGGLSKSGQTINWSIIGGTGLGTLNTTSSGTNASGQATNIVTATFGGTLILRASLASDPTVFNDITITINPTYILSLNAASTVIANGETSALTATLVDGSLPQPGQPIDWSIVGGTGDGILNTTSSGTDISGQAKAMVAATSSGILPLRATVSDDSSVFQDVSITVLPSYNLVLNAPSTNSGSTSTLTATLTDNGIAVSGQQINWSIIGGTGGGTLSPSSSSTDIDGQATTVLTATSSGTVIVRGSLASNPGVHYDITIAVNPSYSFTLSAGTNLVINGGTSTLLATLTDNGTLVSNRQVNWSVVGGSGTLSTSNSSTNASGQATVVVTTTASGPLTLRATLANDSTVYKEITITVTPAYNLVLNASPGQIISGNTSLLTATLNDNGTLVSGQQINWTIVGGTGSGTLSTPNSSTNASGQATVTLNATFGGSLTLRGVLASDSSIHQDVTIAIDPAYALVLDAAPSTIANGSTSILTATLTDDILPVSGRQIDWTITGGTGSGTLNTTSSGSDSNGQATTTLTATKSGTVTLRATLTSDNSIHQDVTVTVTPVYTLSLSSTPVFNGGTSILTATLTDNGTPVSGQALNWSVVGGTGSGTLNPSSSTTDAGGLATTTLTATSSGSIILRGTLANDSSVFQDITVTVTPAYTLALSATPVSNGGTSTLSATLTDNGTPVPGQTINWSVVGGMGSGTLNPLGSTTDAGGLATTALSATGSGSIIVRGTLASDGSVYREITVTVTPSYALALSASPNPVTNGSGQASVTLNATFGGILTLRATLASAPGIHQEVVVTITPAYALALSASPTTISNGDTTILAATLTDNGAAVAGQQINWSIISGPGNGTLSTTSSGTNAGGQATVTLTATTPGTVTVRGTLSTDNSIVKDVSITIAPSAPIYSLALTSSPDPVVLAGTVTFTATLTDSDLAAPGQPINWSIVGGPGNGTLSAATSNTNASGQATITLTTTTPGLITVRASVAADPSVYQEETVLIIALTPSFALSLSASPTTINNGASSALIAQVTNLGVPSFNQQVNWSIVGGTGSGTLNITSSSTDLAGQTTATLSATSSGTLILRATLASDSTIYRNVTITISPLYAITVSALPNPAASGGSAVLTATLTDNGVPVSGQQINWGTISGIGGGTLSTTNSTTNGSGQASATLNTTFGGSLTVRASLTGNSGVFDDVTVSITPSYNLAVSAAQTTITNGASTTLSAILTDNGTSVSGQQIDWSIVGGTGNGTLSTTSSGTNVSGQAGVALNATFGGTVILRATLASNPSIFQDVSVTIIPVYSLSLNASSVINGGTSTLTATLDDNGAPVSGQQINWSVVGGTGSGTLNPSNSTTDIGGLATTNLIATGSGTLTLRGTLASNPAITQTVSITIIPSYSLALSAAQTSITNGGTSILTATLTDNGSFVSGQAINWSIVGGTGNGTLSAAASITSASGQASVTLNATFGGTVIIRAVQASNPSIFQDVAVTVIPLYSLALNAAPTTILNGATTTLTASLTDNGLTVPGQQVNWSVVGGTGSGTLGSPNSPTNAGGLATTTLHAVFGGTLTVRASLASNPSIFRDVSITITPMNALVLSATPPTITNGGTSILTATLTDGGLPVSGQQINWSVTGGTGSGTLSATGSGTNTGGQASTTLTATFGGTVTLRATLASNTSIFQDITVPVSPTYSITVAAPPVTNGGTSTLTATLTDGGLPVSGQQINWSVTGGTGSGTLNSPSSTTAAGGLATTTFTATGSGTVTVRASLASNPSIFQDATITITPSYSFTLNAAPNPPSPAAPPRH